MSQTPQPNPQPNPEQNPPTVTKSWSKPAAALSALAIGAGLLYSQWGAALGPDEEADEVGAPAEFYFARLAYASFYGGGRLERWLTDWPEAETHFLQGVRRLTRIDAAEDGRTVRLTDDELFDYPWLYAVEVGQWYLSDPEAALLREYLDRGGFLMVDDFWDNCEWSVFIQSMLRVFPDRPIVELGEDHELLHVLYDLDQRTQIPGANGIRPGTVPHWRGIFDDDDRLMVAINFNMDMGDAWEHADDLWYPEPMTALAYRFAVNYLIYSMTH